MRHAIDTRQLKFEALLLDETGEVKGKLIFFWQMNHEEVASALRDDIETIVDSTSDGYCKLFPAVVMCQTTSSKGLLQNLDLSNLNTIRDVNRRNEGRLAIDSDEPDIGERDIGDLILANLDSSYANITTETRKKTINLFVDFRKKYSEALRGWISADGEGIASRSIQEQAHAFEKILKQLSEHVNNEWSRENLWAPLLRIGVVFISSGDKTAIVTPWHPLRLAEIAVKSQYISRVTKSIVNSSDNELEGFDLLSEQIAVDLESVFYPEVCLSDTDLLVATSTMRDYSLMESPTRRSKEKANTGASSVPKGVPQAFATVCEKYLQLLPHERSNFSVLLYDTESKHMPQALMEELVKKVEKESELQCDLLIANRDIGVTRAIYEDLNDGMQDDSGSVMASEAAKNFLSRLRVGFLDQESILQAQHDRSIDIVALNDVISRKRWPSMA